MSALLHRLLVVLLLLASALTFAAETGELRVHFFDVGQGDAALIISPTGKTVLVDGGPPDSADFLAARIAKLVSGPLDLVILSHPHLDHLGGLIPVIRKVGARRMLDPGFDHPTRSYAELLEFLPGRTQVLSADRPSETPDTPLRIGLGEGASLTVLWPRRPREPFLRDTRSDANSNSIVFRLQHGKVSFLFTGDAEAETEERLIREPDAQNVTVLKVAHHGGRHSSTAAFLRAVKAEHAVISCGSGNDYGHPTEDTLERLTEAGAAVFRTDLHGELLATSDGESVRFSSARSPSAEALLTGARKGGSKSGGRRFAPPPIAREAAPDGAQVEPSVESPTIAGAAFLASRRSKVFHAAGCQNAQKILKKNLLSFALREEAARTRRPAGDCNP